MDGDASQQEIDEQLRRMGLSDDMGKEVAQHLLTHVQVRSRNCMELGLLYVLFCNGGCGWLNSGKGGAKSCLNTFLLN